VTLRAIFASLALVCALTLGGCGDDADPAPSSTNTPSAVVACATGPAPQPTDTRLPAPVSTATAAPPGASITISAVGDISLAREVVPRMEANGAGYPYELIRPLLTSDIAIGNLEGALTDRGDPWPKGYNFRTPPQFAAGLRDAGFDVVSLANNHAMDYGAVGLTDTLDALDAAGVRHVGGGRTLAEAQAPVVLDANGLRIAVIGCVDTPTEGGGFAIRQWAATDTDAGLFICDDAPLAAAIAAARPSADFVAVIVHAGSEYINAPDATQRRIAENVLAAGADAYIGHHAHVVQPVEQRGSQLIAWGLGNFIFDLDNVDLANIPEPRVSLVLNFTLTKGQGVTSFEAAPVVLDANEDRPRPASPDEAAVLQSLTTP
jgi:poly-gamma-glutamate synthesis protein (capsule biosynthesis protein)